MGERFCLIGSSLFWALPGGYEFKGARVFETSQSTFSVQKDVLYSIMILIIEVICIKYCIHVIPLPYRLKLSRPPQP